MLPGATSLTSFSVNHKSSYRNGPKFPDRQVCGNTEVPTGAVWSGSTVMVLSFLADRYVETLKTQQELSDLGLL